MKRLMRIANLPLKWATITYEYLDEGFCGLDMPAKNITCWQEGELYTNSLKGITGSNGENRNWHEFNGEMYFGNYSEKEWKEFLEDISTNGIKERITVDISKEGKVSVYEGNHRLQAALQLNIETIPAEVRYYGNYQQIEKLEV